MIPARLSVYESGSHLPSLESLAQILRALGASLADLEEALSLVEQRSGLAGGSRARSTSLTDPAFALRHLGGALRSLRLRRNQTQMEVAREAAISRGMLAAYESGTTRPSLQSLGRVLRAIDASLADLDEALARPVPAGAAAAANAETVAEPAAAYAARPAPYPRQVADEILDRLEELSREYERAGRSLAELAPASELATKMVAIVPSPSPWDDLLGPFYGSRQIETLLGDVSRQAVAERRRRRTLLGLRTADGAWVYPAFQFSDEGEVLPGLPAVLQCFGDGVVDDWTLAGWLVSALSSLGGASPIGRLRSDGDAASVLAAARDAARRFAQ